jgi:hypothetical protein
MTHLLGNEVRKFGIAMTQRIDRNTGREVEVFAVVNVPDI